MKKSNKDIFNLMQEFKSNSYSKYSNFWVTAVAVTTDGTNFKGVNVENSAYGDTICAERSALVSAISNGYRPKDIVEIHVLTKNADFGKPCGSCRQVISELVNPEIGKIFMYNNEGDFKAITISQLLPFAFTVKDLKND